MSKFKFIISLLLVAGFTVGQVLMPYKSKNENLICLNGLWKFKYIPSLQLQSDSLFYKPGYNATSWSLLKTPGCRETQGVTNPEYAGNLKEGTGLYLTSFKVPEGWKNQSVYIAFDGVCFGYDFWLNGQYIGSFASSYNRMIFDIAKQAKYGETNTLAVKVSTRVKGWEFDTNDDWSLSGIIRDVNIFSLPPVHIKDFTLKTQVNAENKARVWLNTVIEKPSAGQLSGMYQLKVRLIDQTGQVAGESSTQRMFDTKDTMIVHTSMILDKPKLWTAEIPYLYRLELSLVQNNTELQKQEAKVGLREISIDKGILKLNNRPIKMRGVNHHDLTPVNGRAVTEAEIRQDLDLIKKANINMIRTSHYPPHPRLVELCDSMGIYLVDEVPFGFGDKHLTNPTYKEILFTRARQTVLRDKNSPSVIVWSVGNENPLTENGLLTGKYVKKLDDSRPYCFPSVGSYFKTVKNNYPDSIDILSPHYPNAGNIAEFSEKYNRPLLFTEYAHAFGTGFGQMQNLWETMYKYPKVAGGAIWLFQDQGLLRKSNEKTDKSKFTPYCWIDSVHYYDSYLDKGTDGIVYSNRIPQLDYWVVRKVYSPVKFLTDSINITGGRQQIQVKYENRYDFKNLSDVTFFWEMYGDTTLIQRAEEKISCNPHESSVVNLSIDLPSVLQAAFYTLKLTCKDAEKYQFSEKTVRLISSKKPELTTLLKQPRANSILLQANPQTAQIKLQVNQQPILLNGPYLRVGRPMSLSDFIRKEDTTSADSINISEKGAWSPYLLKSPQVLSHRESGSEKEFYLKFVRPGSTDQSLSGKVSYISTKEGNLKISYDFAPQNAKGVFMEAGLSFLMPQTLTEFRWIGQGPYPTYPGKNAQSEFGFYHLNSADINYNGNYSQVQAALISDKKGNGFILILNGGNLGLEKTSEGIILSHNPLVSGKGNKKSLPEIKINAEKVKNIKAEMTLIPVNSDWSNSLQRLFGKPDASVIPFTPFYHNYE